LVVDVNNNLSSHQHPAYALSNHQPVLSGVLTHVPFALAD
jgi:hypothetical protein